MSNADRAKQHAEKIAIKLRDCIDECVDDAVLVNLLQNSNIKDFQAIKQAKLDIAEMLKFYVDELEGKEKK